MLRGTQSKMSVDTKKDASEDARSFLALKLGLFSYPVLQAADILAHG